MVKIMLYKRIMVLFLFIFIITTAKSAEREKLPTDIHAGVLKQDAKMADTIPLTQSFVAKDETPISATEVRLLIKQVSEMEVKLKEMGKENKELADKLKAVYDHIGAILQQSPPTFKELFTTNKIVWGILLYSALRFVTSGYYAYQTSDYAFFALTMFYVVMNGLEGGADAFIRGYYVGSVLQGLRTLQASIPKPAASKK